MISKEQFIESFTHEMKVIRHLGTKITPDMLDYRPNEKQRSMIELMNYLGHIFATGVQANIAGETKHYSEFAKDAPVVTLENFDSIILSESELVSLKLQELSEEALAEKITIFGFETSRGMHMLNLIKWAAAYKTQLFLYIKANGNHDIGTSNLWGGMDMPPQI